MTANHRDQGVSGGALRIEVVKGQAMRSGIGGIGHGGMQSSRIVNFGEQVSILLAPDSAGTVR